MARRSATRRGNCCARFPGLKFREMPLADICCGSAGIYNVLHTDLSMEILEKKMAQREPGASAR